MNTLLKTAVVLAFVMFTLNAVFGQEFLCQIQVNSSQVQGTDKRVFDNMRSTLMEFVNNRRWTNYDFKPEERIECSMVINIQQRPSVDRFEGTISVVASRPVYKTAYTTTLFNYVDKDFDFDYVEFQPMEFQENSYNSNLTSVVAYYLYIILGLDFDSFSEYGGTPFFQKAEQVVNAAQNSPEKGWSSFDNDKNRYWIIENYLNNSYSELRRFNYEYHRKGLDAMAENAYEGRASIGKSLEYLMNVYDQKPGLFALQLMIDAKRDEIVNIFSEGNPKEKTEAQNIMKEVDPANSSKYSKMTQP